MAKGSRTSLAVRAVALLFALALAALAARLWLGSAPRAASTASDASAGRDAAATAAQPRDAEDAAANGPPLHGDISAKDQEALRKILRDAEKTRP